jgi:hypothetical protein
MITQLPGERLPQASVSPVGPAPTISTVNAFRTCGDGFVFVVSVIVSAQPKSCISF